MSFFKKLKSTFSSGVKTRVAAPNSFNWEDGTLPVTITFTSKAPEGSEVEKLTFTLRGIDEENNKGFQNPQYEWQYDETFKLASEQEESRDFEVPLPTGSIDVGNTRHLEELKSLRQVELVVGIKIVGTKLTINKHQRLKVVSWRLDKKG